MNRDDNGILAVLHVCHVTSGRYIPEMPAYLYVANLSSSAFPTVSEHQRLTLPSMGPFPCVVPETDARAQSL